MGWKEFSLSLWVLLMLGLVGPGGQGMDWFMGTLKQQVAG